MRLPEKQLNGSSQRSCDPGRITLVARAPEVQPKQPAAKPAPRARRERATRKQSPPAVTRPAPPQSPDDAPIVD